MLNNSSLPSTGASRIASQRWSLGHLPAHVLLELHALNPARYPVLLESSAASLAGNNHDILMAFPGEQLSLSADGLHLPSSTISAHTFLAALDQWWQQNRLPEQPHELPFHGGWFVYLAYEFAREIEPSLQLPAQNLIARAVRIPAAIVRNSASGEAWFVAEPGCNNYYALIQNDLAGLPQTDAQAVSVLLTAIEESSQQFIDAVKVALEHIAAGDIYQANLSRGWHTALPPQVTPQMVYRALRRANPAPFAGIAMLDETHAVISSSPERLIELRHGWASTRPIAGTRPRHADVSADRKLLEELHAHPKERAEHIMLLDLERNDLGRICVGGSVDVNEYMSIESYAHVHHIVSNVRGKLREEVTPAAAIAAMFPGGTITGCPKVRCMEIIGELEHTARGAYTGSMGYLNRDGSMDLNILIRTLELNDRTLKFRAGAGIVADSIPLRELEETRAKALGLIRALQA